LLGAATVRAMRDRKHGHEGRFSIFVRPDCRRHGIGTALMRAVHRLAEHEGFIRVATAVRVDERETFLPFFERVGLRAEMTLTTFQFALEHFRRELEPRYELVAGKSPRVRLDHVQSVYDLPPRAVAECAAGEGGLASGYEARLRDRYYCPETSVGLQLDGRVIAVLLTHLVPDPEAVCVAPDGSVVPLSNPSGSPCARFVDFLRVDPEYRSGSVLFTLMMASVRGALARGVLVIAWESDEHYHPTMFRLGRRWHGAEVRRRFLFGASLRSGSDDPPGGTLGRQEDLGNRLGRW
jgi:GNAT superfamily N-acetyltransferase